MLRKAPLGTLMAVILLLAVISMAEDNKAELNTSDLFANRFKKGEIRGTGHLFRIIVDCDKERLQNVSDALSNDETEVVEYDFT